MRRWRLALASALDRVERVGRRVGEGLGWPQAWVREFARVSGDPRLTREEVWVRYAVRRERAQEQLAAVKTEEDALGFYATSDYLLYRQIIHRRHTAWRTVLAGMGRWGQLLEFGCGVAPVSAWLRQRRPDWTYVLVDVPSPHRDYAQARLPQAIVCREVPAVGAFEVITALDVLEHLPDPLTVSIHLVAALQPGGLLYWNFARGAGDVNLATPARREETVAYLRRNLRVVWQTRETIWQAPELVVSAKDARWTCQFCGAPAVDARRVCVECGTQ